MCITNYKYNIGFVKTDSVIRLISGIKNNVDIAWVKRGAYKNRRWI